MKVFISWSGENSKKFAEELRKWLPAVLQFVKPYFTPSDIEKGTRWNSEVAKELELAQVGILCVTRDNLHSDWVMFEAGALSKSMDKAQVCPVLFGIHNTDLSGPLKQFQTTEFEKGDFKKLLQVINNKSVDNRLAPDVLDSVFNKWWPELESEIKRCMSEIGEATVKPVRKDRDVLNEILELSRMATRNVTAPGQRINVNPKALAELLKKFIALHDENCASVGSYQTTLDHLKGMSRAIIYLAENCSRGNSKIETLVQKAKNLPFVVIAKDEEEPPLPDDIPF